MDGRVVTNEQTGAKAWWDGTNLTPLAPEDVQRLEKAGSMQADVKYAQENPGASLMSRAKEQSAKEATQVSGQLARNVGVPLAQTALAVGTGGMSIPAQIAINASTEAALQATGINPPSQGQMVAAAAGPLLTTIPSMVRGVGRLTANLTGRGEQAGEQAMAKMLKVPMDVVERSTYAPSKAIYQGVEKQGQVATAPALQAVQEALAKENSLGSQANKQTIKYLEGLAGDLSTADFGDAAELTARAQRLSKAAEQAERRGNSTLAATLRDAVGQFKGGVPGLKEADVAYTRERVVEDLFKAMRKGNKLKAVDDYIAENGNKIRGVMSDQDIKNIRTIASQIIDMGGTGNEGLFKMGFEGLIKSFIADPNGLTVFRHAFGPNLDKFTPQAAAGIMPFIRGYFGLKEREKQSRGNNQVR